MTRLPEPHRGTRAGVGLRCAPRGSPREPGTPCVIRCDSPRFQVRSSRRRSFSSYWHRETHVAHRNRSRRCRPGGEIRFRSSARWTRRRNGSPSPSRHSQPVARSLLGRHSLRRRTRCPRTRARSVTHSPGRARNSGDCSTASRPLHCPNPIGRSARVHCSRPTLALGPCSTRWRTSSASEKNSEPEAGSTRSLSRSLLARPPSAGRSRPSRWRDNRRCATR